MNNYSGTKCPKCQSTQFELKEDTPNNSNWRYQYLRCSSCYTFLAVLPFNNTNVLLENEFKKIKGKLGILD